MKLTLVSLLFASMVRFAQAQAFISDEEQSRFSEKSYKTALPGMAAPAAYIALAKKSIKGADSQILFRQFSDPVVTYRVYRNAPPADREIIAVQFVYEGSLSAGGTISRYAISMRAIPGVPVLQALIRKDCSKVYLHVIKYKQ